MAKRVNKISHNPTLDLGYLNAATILTRQLEDTPLTIILVGCGGTGSYMALHIGRLLGALGERGVEARAIFVDHDRVEAKNVKRQLFCDAEIGRYKAEVLAYRYGTAWGVDVRAVCERFSAKFDTPVQCPGLTVIVGCVDNAAARKEIARALKRRPVAFSKQPPLLWWLDCGNHSDAGQVLLGNALYRKHLEDAFPSPKICQSLPAPSLQHPELLKAKPEEKTSTRLSCVELAEANLQSLNINSRIAAEASDMLTRLLVTRDLKRFACEINLPAGVMRSIYATPEAVTF